ncbi:MAG: hypothetical protein NC211_07000 [Alistipes senegalensis]|nr:hypothetical protein [Oxalobacter formigenes]MCM1281558.1 hypothetical protein [Alistipes senegalensis]
MQQPPSQSTRLAHLIKRWLVLASLCLLFAPNPAFPQETASYKLVLTNKSPARITKIILAPYGLIQVHAETSLAPGESITLARPACEKMKMEITHSKGQFSFPFTPFANEKNTAMTLLLRKDSVPVLRFEERKKADITGDNADWHFPQILGAVPFGVGKTTLAEAIQRGAKTGSKPNEQETTLLWGNRPWNLAMTFSGNAPESRLRQMEMVAKGTPGKTPAAVHESLMAHGYVYYSMILKQAPKEFYVTVPLARALERANMNGRSLAAVLAAHPNEVVVQSRPGKKSWTVSMTLAPDLVKNP